MASIEDKRTLDADRKEEEDFSTGPLSVLLHSVKNNSQVSRGRGGPGGAWG